MLRFLKRSFGRKFMRFPGSAFYMKKTHEVLRKLTSTFIFIRFECMELDAQLVAKWNWIELNAHSKNSWTFDYVAEKKWKRTCKKRTLYSYFKPIANIKKETPFYSECSNRHPLVNKRVSARALTTHHVCIRFGFWARRRRRRRR